MAEVGTIGHMTHFAREARCALCPVHLSVGKSARLVPDARRQRLTVLRRRVSEFLVADDSVYESDKAACFRHTPLTLFRGPEGLMG